MRKQLTPHLAPRLAPLVLTVALAALPGQAEASLGAGIFIYEGRSPVHLALTNAVKAEWAARGASMTRSAAWPTSLSDYRMIVLSVPAENLSATEQADIVAFVEADGLVLLFEESYAYSALRNQVGNALLSDLGLGSTLGTGSWDSTCSHTAIRLVSNPISAGTSSLEYAYSGDIVAGSEATVLYEGESGQALVVQEGRYVIAADTNMIDQACTLPSTQGTFFGDLYDAICDLDGDLEDSPACGGGDCDDEDATIGGTGVHYYDRDGDGDGDPDTSLSIVTTCESISGYVATGTDCNDSDPSIYTDASEVAYDSIDQDCDGLDLTDVDGDGDDSVLAGGIDCDDEDDSIFPGQLELADGIDQDCDGIVDEETTWYDDDGDGYAEIDGDCDDALDLMSPGTPEQADGLDNDCDLVIDNDTEVYDDDGDGYTEVDGDCDDSRDDMSPELHELEANGLDDDCEGTVDMGSWNLDADEDGYGQDEGDCDDYDDSMYPGAPEEADAKDNDCDGFTDEGTTNRDDDGDGYSENQLDCDDTDPAVSPEAEEVEGNEVDDNCDGEVDERSEVVEPEGDDTGGEENAGQDSAEPELDTAEDSGGPEHDEGEEAGKGGGSGGCSTAPRSGYGLLLALGAMLLTGGRRQR